MTNRLLAILLISSLISCDNKQEQAESIIHEILLFKQNNGYYPNSLDVIFIQANDHEVYFYNVDTLNDEFDLYYGVGLGESICFSSKDSLWHRSD